MPNHGCHCGQLPSREETKTSEFTIDLFNYPVGTLTNKRSGLEKTNSNKEAKDARLQDMDPFMDNWIRVQEGRRTPVEARIVLCSRWHAGENTQLQCCSHVFSDGLAPTMFGLYGVIRSIY